MENRFNLLDEPWIPVEGSGKVSLKSIFLNPSYTGVGGNPIQKMAVYKLLFLIAQSACDIKDEEELEQKGAEGIASDCVEYLERHRDSFYLYGDKPFLQYPELGDNSRIEAKTMYIDYVPDLASENDSILKQSQSKCLSDADKALLLITLVSYSLGGKRTTDPAKYVTGNDERSKSAKTSPSLSDGTSGLVQTLLLGNNILETIVLNYFTLEDIGNLGLDSLDVTILPPWENMPTLLHSDFNDKYKRAFVAWFIPMTRAVLLMEGDKIKYCEELSYKGEWVDPFLTVKADNRKAKIDILKRPWNQIQALLAEIYNHDAEQKCIAVREHYLRARKLTEFFSIWTGGLKLRANSGDQCIKQEDDYLESKVIFSSDMLGELFFERYCNIIDKVNECGNSLKRKISAYKKQLGINDKLIDDGMFSFWYEMGKLSEDFVTVAEKASEAERDILFKNINKLQRNIYDDYCPHGTARQILAWAKNRP